MRSTDIYSIYPETLVIGTSITVLVSPLPGQLSVGLKWGAGGTLWFYGSSISGGCTFATAQQYLIGGAEIVNLASSGPFKLGVSGATTTVYMYRGRSMGFEQT